MKNDELKYWCSDCKCFVKENHRCQQWDTVSRIPVKALEAWNTRTEPKEVTKECKDCGTYSLCKLSGKAVEPCESWSGGKHKEQDVCPEYKREEYSYTDLHGDELDRFTGKAPVDDIRKAFSVSVNTLRRTAEDTLKPYTEKVMYFQNEVITMFNDQQAEIERLKDELKGFKQQYKDDERTLLRLKDENEDLRCCGNCGELDKTKCSFCFRAERKILTPSCESKLPDNWKQREVKSYE